jgi:hypothetical protein
MTSTATTHAPHAGPAQQQAVGEQAASFGRAAAAMGYDDRATGAMLQAIGPLGLTLPRAQAWMDADVTPWGAAVWEGQGFEPGDETREFRRWGLNPQDAYVARHDRGTATMRGLRMLFECLAGGPGRPAARSAGAR